MIINIFPCEKVLFIIVYKHRAKYQIMEHNQKTRIFIFTIFGSNDSYFQFSESFDINFNAFKRSSSEINQTALYKFVTDHHKGLYKKISCKDHQILRNSNFTYSSFRKIVREFCLTSFRTKFKIKIFLKNINLCFFCFFFSKMKFFCQM